MNASQHSTKWHKKHNDIQCVDIQYQNTQFNDIKHNYTKDNYNQHNNAQHCGTQNSDIYLELLCKMSLSIMTYHHGSEHYDI